MIARMMTSIIVQRIGLVVVLVQLKLKPSSSFSAASYCSSPSTSTKLQPRRVSSPFRPSTTYYYRGSSRTYSHLNMNDATELEFGYPVQITHHGHTTSIFVRKEEPILHALERQSTTTTTTSVNKIKSTHPHSSIGRQGEECSSDDMMEEQHSSLALSHIPNECRRGNCLTCTARLVPTTANHDQNNNIQANVNNGLSPTVETELTQLGYILTCCSFVTGPGVALELDQNNNAWDAVYRKRICNNIESMQLGIEAQARLLRRVDEENVGRWKKRMEKVVSDGSGYYDELKNDIFGL